MIRIEFDEGKRVFRPRERVAGAVEWISSSMPGLLEIRLLWHTEHLGTPERHVVANQEVRALSASGSDNFAFSLPELPYSFTGKLVQVAWAIEVAGEEAGTVRQEFTVSPTGSEIRLSR